MEITLADIDSYTKKYADAYADLADLMIELNDAVETVKRARLTNIKNAAAKAAHRYGELEAMLEGAPTLFIKPRTLVLHGIKVGYQKGKGGITFEDPELVVKLIKKHFPDQADRDRLIKTKEAPRKDALEDLTVADLKRIGCEAKDAGDQVLIKSTDTDVAKLVNAIIKESLAEAA